jgi:hypothetical protein
MDARWWPTRLGLAAVLLAAAGPAARAQCDTATGHPIDVAGQVIDARALVPLRASVVLTAGRDTLAALDADSTGFFAATICRRASVVAHFRRIGYRADSLTVAFDSTRWTPLDVAMAPVRDPAGVTLATTRVTAPRTVSAVEARARRTGGVFIGTEEIDRLKPNRTSDLFRARRGVTLEDVDGAMRLVSSRGVRPNITDGGARTRSTPTTVAPRDSTSNETMEPTHGAVGGTESCPLRIGVNGHLMPEEYQLDEVAVADIVAVEIYPGTATIPVQFSSTRHGLSCGLAMVWTRIGMANP